MINTIMLQRCQYWEVKTISKQELVKQLSPDMKLIILANINVKLFS